METSRHSLNTYGLVLAALCLGCLQYVESVPTKGKCNSQCDSPECLTEAEFLSKNINPEADPCDDFFEFACGNFIKNTEIPDDAASVTLFTKLQKDLEENIQKLLEKPIEPSDSNTVKKLKTHFNNCLDKASIEATETKPVLDILNNVGGMPVLQNNWSENVYSWEETVSKIADLGLESRFPITVYVGDDSTDSTKKNLKVDVADLTVRDSFLSDGGKLLKTFENYMVEVAVLLGADRNAAQTDMKACLDFEVELHKIKTTQVDLRKADPSEGRMSVKDLSEKNPGIDWLSLINAILKPNNEALTQDSIIELADVAYIPKLVNLLKNTPKRTLANYQLWKVVNDLIDYMPEAFDNSKLALDKAIDGVSVRPNRKIWCVKKIEGYLPIAVSSMYVRSFDKSVKDKVDELVKNIKDETRSNLETVAWMDETTKRAALEKLDAMDALIAYPEELLDDGKVDDYYNDLDIKAGKFLEDYLTINKYILKDHYQQLSQAPGRSDWTQEPSVAVINAYYHPTQNKIILPAGILQGHFFQSNVPKYINYGSMGFVIGHEITHGFDSEGATYDKDGNIVDWWQEETKSKFEEKSQCMVDQYNNYTIAQIGENAKGDLSVTENIADNGGIKTAYRAYKKWVKSLPAGEQYLPNLDYTPEQMFWISAANVWCTKIKDEALRTEVQDGVHSPNVVRVSVSFSNSEDFANDFKCPSGSKMNPVKKCSVW